MIIGVAEFLDKVSKLKKREEKVNALRNNNTFPVRTVLQGAFDPRIKWILPEGVPPYKVNDLVDQENVLIRDSRKLIYFVEGSGHNLKPLKRETMFVEFLESLAPKDAELILAIKDKKLPFKGITEDIVREAFPELFPAQETKK
jgi:Family of unknown function (DUF6433)